jgi:hypothetical protein
LRIKDVTSGLPPDLVELLVPSNKKKWEVGTSLKAAAMVGRSSSQTIRQFKANWGGELGVRDAPEHKEPDGGGCDAGEPPEHRWRRTSASKVVVNARITN